MYEVLNSSRSIGNLELPNRVVMVALGLGLGDPHGGVSEEIIDFYKKRAIGGVGLIITGITRVKDGAGAGQIGQLAARNWKDINGLRKLANEIHKYDTKIFLQLHHPGNQIVGAMNVQPEAPSSICGTDEMLIPHELTTKECEEIVNDFVRGAKIAQISGIDGVELHAAHFYLLNEFLSKRYNKRKDKYGGNFENRMRLLVEIIEGIKKVCGTDFPVIVRIMADEFLEGGNDLQEGIKIAQRIEKAGADAIDVSCGGDLCIEKIGVPEGSKSYLVIPIKQSVKIPVISVNNIKEPDAAEKLLENGVSDFVGLGRALIADPLWLKKALEGRKNEITKCVSCFKCYGKIYQMQKYECSVNKD